MRGNYRSFVVRGRSRAGRAAGAWLIAGTALIAGAASSWPQPVAAAGSQVPAVRLVIGPAVRRHLLGLYAANRHVPVTSIAPAGSGQVLGARQRGGTDWAMVHWQPSARAGQTAAAGFQDGAGTGVFLRAPGGPWTLAGLGGQPTGCAVPVPQAVRRLWHLPSCRALEAQPAAPVLRGTAAGGVTGALVKVALAQVGVADNPPVTSFNGTDCNPYTTLVGNPLGASGTHCKTSSNGSYFHNVPDVSEFWCADFTKWVWEQAGVTGRATLTPSAASFYTWGTKHGEHISFGGTPRAGDAVILYPPGTKAPNGSYADHVGIVTAVHADGTVSLVNGDFLGPANIAVRYIVNAHLTAWASWVEGSKGEKWALVSPAP